MLEAGTRTASPDRSKRTSPVAASCTTPVKLPAPSTFRVWLSCAAREPGSGTGAVAVSGSILSGSPLWAPPADSVPGTWCQGGADGPAVAGAGAPKKPGATARPAGSASATTSSVWSSSGRLRRSGPVTGSVPAGLVLRFMLLLVL